jgi:hypothetical protein
MREIILSLKTRSRLIGQRTALTIHGTITIAQLIIMIQDRINIIKVKIRETIIILLTTSLNKFSSNPENQSKMNFSLNLDTKTLIPSIRHRDTTKKQLRQYLNQKPVCYSTAILIQNGSIFMLARQQANR